MFYTTTIRASFSTRQLAPASDWASANCSVTREKSWTQQKHVNVSTKETTTRFLTTGWTKTARSKDLTSQILATRERSMFSTSLAQFMDTSKDFPMVNHAKKKSTVRMILLMVTTVIMVTTVTTQVIRSTMVTLRTITTKAMSAVLAASAVSAASAL